MAMVPSPVSPVVLRRPSLSKYLEDHPHWIQDKEGLSLYFVLMGPSLAWLANPKKVSRFDRDVETSWGEEHHV